MDRIYCLINDLNKFWSKIIALNLAYYSFIIGIFSFLYFGELSLILSILLTIILIIQFLLITSLTLMESSVNTESKRTYKLLGVVRFTENRFIETQFIETVSSKPSSSQPGSSKPSSSKPSSSKPSSSKPCSSKAGSSKASSSNQFSC